MASEAELGGDGACAQGAEQKKTKEGSGSRAVFHERKRHEEREEGDDPAVGDNKK